MRWEHLTYPDFERAVQTCAGVGIVPVGVIEPHGAHLPLGTDTTTAHWIACRAAEREAAIVFPAYPWGINHEGAHLPGSVVVRRGGRSRMQGPFLERGCWYRASPLRVRGRSGHEGWFCATRRGAITTRVVACPTYCDLRSLAIRENNVTPSSSHRHRLRHLITIVRLSPSPRLSLFTPLMWLGRVRSMKHYVVEQR